MNARPGARPVCWALHLAEGPAARTTAWVVSLAEAERQPRPMPTARDLVDVAGRSGDDRRRFLLRRTTLRLLAARRSGVPPDDIQIGYDVDGAPRIRMPDGLFCSVSARGDVAAFALSDIPIGVDIEPLVSAPIAWAALSRPEADRLLYLAEADRLTAFLQIFTLKEAYLKACGSGLLRDPAELTVSLAELTIQDGVETVRLPSTAIRDCEISGRSVLAACVALDQGDASSGN